MLTHLRARLPRADLLYLADQAHVPYGDRAPAELAALLERNVALLEELGATSLAMGCNTSCAVAADLGWPDTRLRIYDLIAAAAAAVAATGARHVGVVATAATARAGAYGRALRDASPGIAVREIAAPALVPLVEAGALDGARTRAAVAEACAALGAPLDAVVLGCTHYPLLDARFAEALPGVARVDPAVAQAERVAADALHRDDAAGAGTTRYVTTGALAPFRAAVERIVGADPRASFASAPTASPFVRPGSRSGSSGSDEPEDPEEDEDARRAERGAGDDLQRRVLT